MTTLFSTATMTPDDGIVVAVHLSLEDAYECLRINFCPEIAQGDVNEIVEELTVQNILFEVTMHEVDLSDVRAEYPAPETT